MKEWQERVVKELEELEERTDKLASFLASQDYADLNVIDQGLLSEQFDVMLRYRQILDERIKRFGL